MRLIYLGGRILFNLEYKLLGFSAQPTLAIEYPHKNSLEQLDK